MNTKTMLALAFLGASTLTVGAFAQSTPKPMPHHGMMTQDDRLQNMINPAFLTPPAPKSATFGEFPTPDELARLVPPEPLTEQKIKQRFANRRELLQKAIEQDRKRAEKYARDFDRYQKFQAEQLATIMAEAEKQRELMLKRLDQREQRVLENFRQRNQPVPAAKTQ